MIEIFREKLGTRFTGRVIGFVNKTGTATHPYQLIVKPHPAWEGKPLKGVLSTQAFAKLNRKLVQAVYENGQWLVIEDKPPPVIEFEPPKKKKYIPIKYNPHGKQPQYQGGCSGCGKNKQYPNKERK